MEKVSIPYIPGENQQLGGVSAGTPDFGTVAQCPVGPFLQPEAAAS